MDPEDDLFQGLSEEDLKHLEECDIDSIISQPIKKFTLAEIADMDEGVPASRSSVDMTSLRRFMEEQANSYEDIADYITYVKKSSPEKQPLKEQTKNKSLDATDELAELGVDEISELAGLLGLEDGEANEKKVYRYEEKALTYDQEDEEKIDIDDLVAKVESKHVSTKELRLNNFGTIKPKVFVHLMDQLKLPDCIISKLELANCNITDIYVEALAEGLCSNKSITSLNLETNNISLRGFKALFESLKQHESLVELRIANQQAQLGFEGEKLLIDLLAANRRIKKLSHYFNNIGFRGQHDSLMLNR